MTDMDQQNVDRAELAKLLVKYGELSADRDEWKAQHENLLAMNRKLNEIIAALRREPERPPSGEMVMVQEDDISPRCPHCGQTFATGRLAK